MPLRPIVLALALALPLALPLKATAMPTSDTAAVRGTLLTIATSAEVSRTPDIANISTGVVTQSGDANLAMRDNAQKMDKVMAALRAAGIGERDLQTSGINLNPQYKYVENMPPAIVGYQASNTVSVKVRDLAKLGKVLDALVAQGANQLNGPSFSLDKPEAALEEARIAAVKKAQAQAQTYANTLGMKVLRIISINEGGARAPTPRPMYRMAAAAPMAMAADTAVATGESTVSVEVEMVFELDS